MNKIIFVGWLGDMGAKLLYQNNREALEKRFSRAFLASVNEWEIPADEEIEELTEKNAEMIEKNADQTKKNAEKSIIEAPETQKIVAGGSGGLYQMLWTLATEWKTGFQVNMKQIPFHQEVIEICEALGINPFEIRSDGCALVVAEEGEEETLLEALRERGLNVEMIGQLTKEKGKVLLRNEEVHYLNRPVKKLPY